MCDNVQLVVVGDCEIVSALKYVHVLVVLHVLG